ncbi:hypothetical protein F5Y08DRAFT_349553 [Xylaria arbuscula]|uniref:Rhodopsin domain-containing protein n=1 Tax=Xylaria arbuscula TaxID=114810 RepID=A0A9W8NKK7_9PEZI|nr:hypothetical protein F5Y08DRAFT_349553 [Xylaria arbuscula]KAJ3578217.1 hypothetical protein NPX13_g2344 [Xylaria arbuscula]
MSTTHVQSDVDRGPSLIGIYTSQSGLAFIFLVLRIWSRVHIGGFGWDDAVMIFSWITYVALTVLVVLMATDGSTRHMWFLDEQQLEYITKLNFIARPFGIVAVASIKIAIALLILRVLKNTASKAIKYTIYVTTIVNTLINILDAIFLFAQCDIPAALWDPALKPKAHCWEPSIKANFATASSSLNVVTDFILAVIPAVIIWRLHMSVNRRLGLIILLGSSIVSVISAAIKTALLARPVTPDTDVTWESYDLYAWQSAEVFVLHLCASVPTFKPLWDRYNPWKKIQEFSRQGYKLSDTPGQPNPLISNFDKDSGHVQYTNPPSITASALESGENRSSFSKTHGFYLQDHLVS